MRITAFALALCATLALSGCMHDHHRHDRHPGHRYEKPVHHKKDWDKPKPPHHKEVKHHKEHRSHDGRHPDRKPR